MSEWDELSEEFSIEKGVRQGWVCSPDLSLLYSEKILDAIEEMPGVLINGLSLSNLRYAADTVIAELERDFQALVNKVSEQSEKYAMKLNVKKTQVLVATNKQEEIPVTDIRVNGVKLLQVKCFKYLGTAICWNAKDELELKQKIGVAKDNFTLMRRFLCNKNIALRSRYEALKMYILPIVFYNSETWTVTNNWKVESKPSRFVSFAWWGSIDKENEQRKGCSTNATTTVLLRDMTLRQVKFFGHVMRKRTVEHLVVTGRLLGKQSRGRERTNYLFQFPRNAIKLIRRNDDRRKWRLYSHVAANVWTYRPGNFRKISKTNEKLLTFWYFRWDESFFGLIAMDIPGWRVGMLSTVWLLWKDIKTWQNVPVFVQVFRWKCVRLYVQFFRIYEYLIVNNMSTLGTYIQKLVIASNFPG